MKIEQAVNPSMSQVKHISHNKGDAWRRLKVELCLQPNKMAILTTCTMFAPDLVHGIECVNWMDEITCLWNREPEVGWEDTTWQPPFRELLHWDCKCSLQHISREANQCADDSTKQSPGMFKGLHKPFWSPAHSERKKEIAVPMINLTLHLVY